MQGCYLVKDAKVAWDPAGCAAVHIQETFTNLNQIELMSNTPKEDPLEEPKDFPLELCVLSFIFGIYQGPFKKDF